MPLTLFKGKQVFLSPSQIDSAFGNFSQNNTDISGQGSSNINRQNIVLPDGMYNICFWASTVSDCPISCDVSGYNNGCSSFNINCNPVNAAFVNTTITPPLNPLIKQFILNSGFRPIIQFNSAPGCNNALVKILGKIDRLSPSPFTIITNSDYIPAQSLQLFPGSQQPITTGVQMNAFADFDETKLVANGIDLSTIRDANGQLKLPDGNYRVCYYARYFDSSNGSLGGNASNPNLGCASFTICNQAGGAPQFTQPINSLNINSEIPLVRPASPVIFTWLAPQSTCGLPPGGFKYDLEIRELLDNQNVTDAINNPFVFRKMGLPSTTFLLDTNLNRNVLQEGKRYAIRVRAVSNNTNSPVEIDNDGYSRIEAFQYGSNLTTTRNGVHVDPQDYYIPFRERKSNFWDDVYHSGRDTLVPVKEYIAFALTQNATAYSLDAIDLFLAMNPELAEVKNVKINYAPQLPVFPGVSANDRINFEKEHQVNLEANSIEKNKFLKYLDTLNNYKQKIPSNALKLTDDLKSHLNSVKGEIDSVDQVTVNYVNMVLAEFLYEMRLYGSGMNNNQYNQLQGLVSTLMDLTSESVNSTSFVYPLLFRKASSLNSYNSLDKKYPLRFTESDSAESLFAAIVKQLLPYDVIVWRNSKEPPYKPVVNAPDLTASHQIFYTLSKLYNHRNPEVNAKSSNRLASTIQVSLPSNTVFKFWTLNMTSHKTTSAEDVDLMDVLEHAKRVAPDAKKPSIVIKVD